MKLKPLIIFDKNKSSQRIKRKIIHVLNSYSLKKSNVILVIGGDGFMLQTLKKYHVYKKPFYGINSGSYGFLMNKFLIQNMKKDLKKFNLVTINPVQMTVKTKLKQIKKNIAINEVSILRQSKQAANLEIKTNKKVIIKKLISDGVLISTPAGSTAYNMSVHGPILNLDSKKLAITPVSSFRPRRWKGKIVSDNSIIKIKNLNIYKRPISSVADNNEVRNAETITIKVNKNIKFNLLYNKNNTLQKKIKLEQIKRET